MGDERETTLPELAGTLAGMAASRPGGARLLVGVAGPPGAGKSTCAGMLSELGLRPRKGAPETFEFGGFRHMLVRLKRNEEAEIAVPVFDRDLEISRAGARLIPRDITLLIVEGNYLLLDRKPWSGLAPLFDATVNIRVLEAALRQRLFARWERHGIPTDEIPAKVEANDLPNGVLVLARSLRADFVLRN